MADKLDPVEFQEWMDATKLMDTHAKNILKHDDSPLKEEADEIVEKLSSSFPTHGYSITVNEAKGILGENFVAHSQDYPKVWDIMGVWLRKYVMEESAIHFIRYILPKKKKGGKSSEKE